MPTPYLLLADDADLKPGVTPFIFNATVKLNIPTSLRNAMTLNAYYGPIIAFQDILVFITTADHTNVKFRVHAGLLNPSTLITLADFTPTQNIVNNTAYALTFQRSAAGTTFTFAINGSVVNSYTIGVTDTLKESIPAGRSICLGIPPAGVITGALALPDNPTAIGTAIIDDAYVSLLSSSGNRVKYRLRVSSYDDENLA